MQVASWLTFVALFITPGWLAADLLTWQLDVDWLERLAVAFPLGIAIMAVPGIMALLLHITLIQLTVLWIGTVALVVLTWLIFAIVRRTPPTPGTRWTNDERILLILLLAAFVYILPTLNLYKIDGDAYAVSTFAADALAGLPLNATEPLFGTNIGPGVRMVFNQSLPMNYLWSYFSALDPITLTAIASRSMVALWIMLSAYALGKVVGALSFGEVHGRRFGLFVTALQVLIFIAAPFLRGDNVSLFFFERTTADKFMVPTTMLPVAFAFTLRYLAKGQRSAWWTAAVVAFAVSTIHPLIAAMLALALTAVAGFHWLLHLRERIIFWRMMAVGSLVALTMVLPLLQLVLSNSEEPLAPSYPKSIEGWSVGYKKVPALPFLYVPTLDVVGPLPDLTQLQASDANAVTNPFLIWRFAVNMDRRRLILFDLKHYISDPNIFMEPPYLLALLLLPFLFWKLRSDLGAQFVVSTTLAILFVMFNPFLTPIIGDLVMPWILWRFVWILPYALIIALVLYRLLDRMSRWARRRDQTKAVYAPLGVVVAASLLLGPVIGQNVQDVQDRAESPYYFPSPTKIFDRLQALTLHGEAKTVMADQDVSVTLPAFVAKANVVAHRMPTTSEIFPNDQQDEALQRLIDQAKFFRSRYLTTETVNILKRYNVGYVIASSGSDLDIQLRAATQWFSWVLNDESYSLYAVQKQPTITAVIDGNTALGQRMWDLAENDYQTELKANPKSILALLGLAEIAHAKGHFTNAIAILNQASAQGDQSVFHYRLGQIYAELGQKEQSVIEYTKAQQGAPEIARFSLALGDACLIAGRDDCAVQQFADTVKHGNWPDAESRMVALADLWRQRGQMARALTLYEQAVARKPGIDNQLMLANVYQEAGRFPQAEALLKTVQAKHPLSTEPLELMASVKTKAGQAQEAVQFYQRSIWLQDMQGADSVETQLALAQTLLDTKQLNAVQPALDRILRLQPDNAIAYHLQGDLNLQQSKQAEATQAYQHAFRLDPTGVSTYIALSSQLRDVGGQQSEMTALLQRAIKASPDEAILALALGDQLEQKGDTQGAIDTYHSVLDLLELNNEPNKFNARAKAISRAYAYARLANVSEESGQMESAMNYYAAAAAAVPDLSWPQMFLGDASRRQGDLTAAQTAYTKAITNDPNSVEAYMRMVDLYEARGDQTKAEAYQQHALQIALTQSLKTVTQSTPISSTLANATYQPTAQKTNKALQSDETLATKNGAVAPTEDAKQLIANLISAASKSGNLNLADAENGNVFRLVAHLYQTGGQPEQARQLFEQLIQIGAGQHWHPATLAGYQKGLGDVYLVQNKPAQAAAAYTQALTLDNWWPQPRLGLARALADLGKTDAAIQQLRKAVEIAPGYVEAQVALASALDHQGAHDEALRIYQQTADAHAGNALATVALGHAWLERGQWDKAEQSYRATIAVNPGSSDGYVGLASILTDQARFDEAQKFLDKAFALDRQNVNAYIQSGVLAQRLGDDKQALDWFNKATNLRLSDPSIALTLVDLLRGSGNYATAITYIQDRLQQRPDDADLLLRLADIQRTQGNYPDALAALLKVEQANHADSRVSAALGELYLTQGKPSDALAIYRAAITVQPTEANYYLKAAELWQNQNNLDRAEETLRAGLDKATRPAALYAALAKLALQHGQPDDANEILQQGLQKVGEETDLVTAMGDYLVIKSADQAEQWYHDVLTRQPQNGGLYIGLGNLALRVGKPTEAVTAYRQALALEPANAGYYVVLGNALEAAKKVEDALPVYRQALTLQPTLVDAYVSLAALYQKQQKWDEAEATFQRGLAVAPVDGGLRVQYAAFLLKREQKDKAQALLDDAGKVAPTRTTLVARAAVYKSLDRKDDALQDLQAALALEPGSVDVLLALNQLYRDQGNTAQAQQTWEQVLMLNPGLKGKK